MTLPANADPMLGLVIHNYRITKLLASGGMGAAYLAEHTLLPQKCVIKTLLPAYASHPILRDRFEREAQAAARLKHPHIISVDNFGVLPSPDPGPGLLYLMMPFLEGEPLDAYVHRHGKLPLHRAVYIVLQICGALHYAHEQGLIHRDLKPANIFISTVDGDRYYVTIIDLGISKDVAHPEKGMRTNTGLALGTPYYMPVEQYSSAGSAGPQADVFSIAVITWELLAATWPWGAVADERILYHKQMTETPVPTPDIPPDVAMVLLRALRPDASERYPSARAFAVALASCVPAIPPFVPSGADMLRKVAPRLVDDADSVIETIRNNASHEHLRGPMTPPPSIPRALGSDPGALPHPAVANATPAQPPTVNARPPHATPMAEVVLPTTAPGKPRRRLGALAIAVAVGLGAGAVTFAVLRGRSSTSADPGVGSTTPVPTPSAPVAAHTEVMVDAQPAAPAVDAMPVMIDAALPVRHQPPQTKIKQPPASTPGSGSAGTTKGSARFDPNAVGGDE